jgi:hypothetical protein
LFALLYQPAPSVPEVAEEEAVHSEQLRPAWVGLLGGSLEAAFPANVAWPALCQLDKAAPGDADALPNPDPVAFLEQCLKRYDRDVQGYTVVMQKQERVGKVLHPKEIIDASFREKPFSVRMDWKQGERRAKKVLFVEGQHDGQIVIRPAGRLAGLVVVTRPLTDTDVKQSGRIPINEFGMKIGSQRVLNSWKAAQQRKTLHVEYLGVFRVKDAGDRLCYKLHRKDYERPEEDGITDLVIYIDKETWLQVGSVLRGKDGMLIGEYYFRDVRLNPKIPAKVFERSSL